MGFRRSAAAFVTYTTVVASRYFRIGGNAPGTHLHARFHLNRDHLVRRHCGRDNDRADNRLKTEQRRLEEICAWMNVSQMEFPIALRDG